MQKITKKNMKKDGELFAGVSSMMYNAIKHTIQVARSPIRSAVLVRALDNISQVVESLDNESLESIVSSSTNLDVLLSLSEQSLSLEAKHPGHEDTLKSLHLEGLRAKKELLEREGGVINSARVAGILGMSRQSVDKRRKQGKLLAVTTGKRGYLYPVWQFGDGGVLPGFEDILSALSDLDPWMKMIFMLGGNSFLDNRTPLELLREGHVEKILKAARAIGEQGAL